MTIFEFDDLHEAEKHEALWQHGYIIGARIEGDYKIMLYRLFSFYVELYHNLQNKILKRIKSFSNIRLGYLYNDIDLKSAV